jgi:hypothetical protein
MSAFSRLRAVPFERARTIRLTIPTGTFIAVSAASDELEDRHDEQVFLRRM